MLMSLEKQIDALCDYSQRDVHRVKTGLPTVDEVCGGPAPGEVFTIIGRSFTGKSIVAQNIIKNNPNVPSIFFSLEMPYLQAIIRMYSMWSGSPAWQIQRLIDDGGIPDDIYGLVNAFPLHRVVDRSALAVDSMSKYVDQFREEYSKSPAFVVVDYLELVGGAKISAEGYKSTESQIAQLKDWAKVEDVAVFLVHQCNMREPLWEPPTEDSPRGGGYAESDFMIGLWRPHRSPEIDNAERRYLQDKLYVNIIKNRAYFEGRDEIVYRFEPSLNIREESYVNSESVESATSGSTQQPRIDSIAASGEGTTPIPW